MSCQVLGVIPARGGSKRVPDKNLRDVGGKPLIAHTISQAEEADYVTDAVVSTDDDEIATVAEEHGGNVPFRRPESLATDEAGMADVVTHALEWCSDHYERKYDVVAVLQVTSPLRTSADVDGGLEALLESEADSVVSVSAYDAPITWAVDIGEDGFLRQEGVRGRLFREDPERSQDTDTVYHPNGALFAVTVSAWREHETYYTPRTVPYVMPPKRSFDIDEPWELELVRALFEHREM